MKRFILVVLAFASFLVGGLQINQASAAIPQPCPKYKCVLFFAWWEGGIAAVTAKCMYDPVTAGVVHVGMTDTFALASGVKDPVQILAFGGWVRDHSACIPMCGFEPFTLKWQAPQTVQPAGLIGPVPAFNTPYTDCTGLGTGPDGNLETPPLSDNQHTLPNPGTPPGVVTDTTD